MRLFLCSDWLHVPEWSRWAHLACLVSLALVLQDIKNSSFGHAINPLLTTFLLGQMAGYWSGFFYGT